VVFMDPCQSDRLYDEYTNIHREFDNTMSKLKIRRSPFKEIHEKIERLENQEKSQSFGCRFP